VSEKYEDLRAKFDAEMRDRIENPLKHMARRDLADELQHCIDDTNVGQPNRYVSVSLLERAISRIRELEDDRDSWAEQASQRVADWQREHDLRVVAERRVGELERTSQTGSGEADTARMVAVMDLTVTMSGTPPAFTTYAYGSVFGHPMPAGVFTLYARGDAIDAARAAMGGKE